MGAIWMALLWIGIPAAVIWALRSNNQQQAPRQHAIEILSERFARGEIDRTEFEARRAELTR
jgi:uncharacterized membrane protein